MPFQNDILGGASGQGGAFLIDGSLYIGDSPDSSPKIKRTLNQTGSTNPVYTFATWFKKGGPCTGAKDFFYVDCATPGASADFQLQISNDRANSTNAAGLVWGGQGGSPSGWFWDTSLGAGSLPGNLALRDHSAWTHLCFTIDADNSPYVYVYFNGVLQDPATIWNIKTSAGYAAGYSPVSGDVFQIGCNNSNQLAGMYFAHTYWIEQQALTAAAFGEFNEDTGQFVPIKYDGGAMTGNSFFLDYADSSDLGADRSGLGNDFTITSIAAYQQCEDSPTNNFAVLNSNIKQASAGSGNWVKNGARMMIMPSGDQPYGTTIPLTTGKFYCEFVPGSGNNAGNGIIGNNSEKFWDSSASPQDGDGHILYAYDGNKNIDGTGTSYGATYTAGDIIGMAVDLDASPHTVTFYKNNASQGLITFTGDILNAKLFIPGGWAQNGNIYFNSGTDSSFFQTKTAQNNSDGNGYGDFYYTPPSGYLAICTQNLPDPAISGIQSAENMDQVIWTGAGNTPSSTRVVGFQPDLVWYKMRDGTESNSIYDSVRGVQKRIISNATDQQTTRSQGLLSFEATGFTNGNDGEGNQNTKKYVGWCWKAGGAPTVDNSAGAGNTPTAGSVKVNGSNYGSALAGTTPLLRGTANTTYGYSFVTYIGNGGSSNNVAHLLSEAPEWVFAKNLISAYSWPVAYNARNNQQALYLNSGNRDFSAGNQWGSTSPSSTLVYLGASSETNSRPGQGDQIMMYCFHSVPGFSIILHYTGNGNSDGTFLYMGFRPKYVIFKDVTAANGWAVLDQERNPNNLRDFVMTPNTNDAVYDYASGIDFMANGIKLASSNGKWNDDGQTYTCMAFADSPFKWANANQGPNNGL